MRVNQHVGCQAFPCADVRHDCYLIPGVDVRPQDISLLMISEAAPPGSRRLLLRAGQPPFPADHPPTCRPAPAFSSKRASAA